MFPDESTLKRWAREAGFCECALCSADAFEWAREKVTSQPQLKERAQLRFAPREDYPQGRSLAVLLWPYAPAQTPEPGCVFVDSYYDASNAAYHAARQLEKRLLDAGCYAKANVAYPAKSAAVRAGMGIIGHSSLLITHRYGTRVVIILMAVGIEAEEGRWSESGDTTGCLSCGRCAKACPSGAIDETGMAHPERCLRNFMMEGVVVPPALRERMGMRLIGCDMCQRVCPMQPKMPEAGGERLPLDAFVTDDPAVFSATVSALAARIGRNAARPQRVRAQAAILAGNSGKPSYLPVLRGWAASEFDTVRAHARWAIGRIEAARKPEREA